MHSSCVCLCVCPVMWMNLLYKFLWTAPQPGHRTLPSPLSNALKLLISVQSLSRVWLFVTPRTAARQASIQLLESTQPHGHWVGDAIQPSHPLWSVSPPAFNLSQHQATHFFIESHPLPRPNPWKPLTCSPWLWFVTLRILYKWNHAACHLLRIAFSFSTMPLRSIQRQVGSWVYQEFALF